MRDSASRLALASSLNDFVCDWPAVPRRPKRTVNELLEDEISQNLRDRPLTNSKRRVEPAVAAGAGKAAAAGVGAGFESDTVFCGGVYVVGAGGFS